MSSRSVSSRNNAYRYRLLRYRTKTCHCNKEAHIFVTKSNANGNQGCLFVRCVDGVCRFIEPFEPEVVYGGYEALEDGVTSRAVGGGIGGGTDLKKLEKYMKALEAKQSKILKQQFVLICFIAVALVYCFINGRI